MEVIRTSYALQPQQVRAAAKGLNAAGVRYFEVSHGDGLVALLYSTACLQLTS